ncbi:hypothetical protein E4U53_006275 [Claviceps sorghi]|nr:hypothetical protein E4U53_006275 [Claviceps sorghi]
MMGMNQQLAQEGSDPASSGELHRSAADRQPGSWDSSAVQAQEPASVAAAAVAVTLEAGQASRMILVSHATVKKEQEEPNKGGQRGRRHSVRHNPRTLLPLVLIRGGREQSKPPADPSARSRR